MCRGRRPFGKQANPQTARTVVATRGTAALGGMDTLLEPLLRDNDLHHERERVLIVGLAAPTLTCTSRTTVALAQCDVLVHVCGWLAVCDVLSISRTCASIRTAASSKQMWRMLLLRDMHPYSSTVHVHLDVAADTESCYKWR